ncbi:MAG TPA: ABC transporter ATP-binding protein [Clostridia bacterium]|jgi:spermidine/putrescine transport system ATP-binding protein|nr:ABC transporter ATP-binding protein [Clostridia bacterium]
MVSNDKIIEIKKLSKDFDGKAAVRDVSFSIKKGEFVTLLGPSGCGKSTILRMIAGFEKPTGGTIYLSGQDITDLPPHKRPVNTVFQKYALFPHLNVFNNIAFGLKLKEVPTGEIITDKKTGEKYDKMRKLTKDEINDKVNRVLKLVDLEDFGYRNVNSLSGGQQQRVAIARAIVNEPEILLLDEPLGALDLKMRKDMQMELMKMHKTLGITFIYVTHDQEEALTMSDTIIVMRNGEIQQIGTAQKIYDEPANAFVADFIGESNIFSGIMIKDRVVNFCEHTFECVDTGFKKNQPIDVIIRPEDIFIIKGDEEKLAKAMVRATVNSCVFKGDHYQIICTIKGEQEENEILIFDNIHCNPGEVVGLFIRPDDIHIMNKSRIINEIDTEMWDEGVVEICGGRFECDSDLPSGTKVRVKIDFDDIEICDDEEDGIIGATVVSTIYKGSYYQCVLRTDNYYDFFADTDDEWMKGDRVGIKVAKDKIIIEKVEVSENED